MTFLNGDQASSDGSTPRRLAISIVQAGPNEFLTVHAQVHWPPCCNLALTQVKKDKARQTAFRKMAVFRSGKFGGNLAAEGPIPRPSIGTPLAPPTKRWGRPVESGPRPSRHTVRWRSTKPSRPEERLNLATPERRLSPSNAFNVSKQNFRCPRSIVASRTLMMTSQSRHAQPDVGPKIIMRVPIDAIEIGIAAHSPTQPMFSVFTMTSISERGFCEADRRQELGYSRYKLLYGYHRLQAFPYGFETPRARRLSTGRRPMIVYEMEMPAWAAELKEISENLFRKNLSQPELEEHRVRYAMLLKRNNLTVDGKISPGTKPKGR